MGGIESTRGTHRGFGPVSKDLLRIGNNDKRTAEIFGKMISRHDQRAQNQKMTSSRVARCDYQGYVSRGKPPKKKTTRDDFRIGESGRLQVQ